MPEKALGFRPFSDCFSETPELGFEDHARHLADRLRAARPRLTLGIFGGYGSGKTTLMRAIQTELGKEESDDLPVQTVWFDAWRYDNSRNLALPLLSSLVREGVATQEPAAARAFLNGLRGLVYGLTLKGGVFEFALNKVIEREAKLNDGGASELKKLLQDYDDVPYLLKKLTHGDGEDGKPTKRIVVFIDDLDRCAPQKAFALIAAIKAFMDVDGWIWVLGLDPRLILSEAETRLFGVDPREFLQKIINEQFFIPDIVLPKEVKDLRRVLRGGETEQKDEDSADTKLIEAAAALHRFLPATIRGAKRTLNVAQRLLHSRGNENAAPKLVLALSIVQQEWPEMFYLMQVNGESFAGLFDVFARGQTDSEKYRSIAKVQGDALLKCATERHPFRNILDRIFRSAGHQAWGPLISLMGTDIDMQKRFRV